MLLPLHDDNPLKHIRFQYVTVGVIAACVAVFVFQLTLSPPPPRGIARHHPLIRFDGVRLDNTAALIH